MGDQHHGHALLVQVGQQAHDVLAGLRVQGAGGLIGQNQFRIVHQGARNRHPLLLAARQFGRRVPITVTESHLF